MTVDAIEAVVKLTIEQILAMACSVLPNAKQPRSYIGIANGKVVKGDDLEALLPPYRLPQKDTGTSTALPFTQPVVARIDEWSKGRTDDLPLVIAVGINPGDGCERNRAMASLGLYARTNLRSRLDQAFELALSAIPSGHQYDFFPQPGKYHLVVVYLFPLLTEKPWEAMELSPIEEGLLVYGLGYSDPLLALNTLTKLLVDVNQQADWVVFHGSSPLIPHAASLFVQQRPKTGPDVLICDDLTGTAPLNSSVVLGRSIVQRQDTLEMNVDE